MKVTLFEKSGNLCYSTSHKVPASKYEDLLISMGWRFVGAFTGRDICSYNIPTMMKIIKDENLKWKAKRRSCTHSVSLASRQEMC